MANISSSTQGSNTNSIDLSIFEGAKPEEQTSKQLGSNGRLKGRKVSFLRKLTQKFTRSSDRKKAYDAKRSVQMALADRRINTLKTLKSTDALAHNLDQENFNSENNQLKINSENSDLLKTLQTVYTNNVLETDQVVMAGKERLLAMSISGSQNRVQKDITTILKEVIPAIQTPHGLVSADQILLTALNKKMISQDQYDTLKKDIIKQLSHQFDSFRKKINRPIKGGSHEDRRDAYLARLNDIQEMISAMKQSGGNLFYENTSFSGKSPRKQLRKMAKDSFRMSSENLKASDNSLTETKRRLDDSYYTMTNSLRPIIFETSSSNKVAKNQFDDIQKESTIAFNKLNTKLNKPRHLDNYTQGIRIEISKITQEIAKKQAQIQIEKKTTKNSMKLSSEISNLKQELKKKNEQYNETMEKINSEKNKYSDWNIFYLNNEKYRISEEPISKNANLLLFANPKTSPFFSRLQFIRSRALLDLMDKNKHDQQKEILVDHLKFLVTKANHDPDKSISFLELAYQYSMLNNDPLKDAIASLSQKQKLPNPETFTASNILYSPEKSELFAELNYIRKTANKLMNSTNHSIPTDSFTLISQAVEESFSDLSKIPADGLIALLEQMETFITPEDKQKQYHFDCSLEAFKTGCTALDTSGDTHQAVEAFKNFQASHGYSAN